MKLQLYQLSSLQNEWGNCIVILHSFFNGYKTRHIAYI
ncbi:hypothetical protein GPAL_0908 [Glaciecola pallidula DSM 14239 = ACAM 615]|uniref:Uncharacterized protein n=1 Tax=Brumicola pallidula DSM 14239 = ACAM 615 TaxID=1121922 RepID=K6ZFW1_9ALTE|nr:hypothetical protein GPAL_0908 [Glaciecola pallidula DSM 14239 = ACAM 615]